MHYAGNAVIDDLPCTADAVIADGGFAVEQIFGVGDLLNGFRREVEKAAEIISPTFVTFFIFL